MLDDCIDISGARQNTYVINPNFDPALKEINKGIKEIKARMDDLRRAVERDLKVPTGAARRGVQLVDSGLHTFVFEVDKKDGDAGVRKSRNDYKVLSTKNRVMTFTCEELKELVRQYYDLD